MLGVLGSPYFYIGFLIQRHKTWLDPASRSTLVTCVYAGRECLQFIREGEYTAILSPGPRLHNSPLTCIYAGERYMKFEDAIAGAWRSQIAIIQPGAAYRRLHSPAYTQANGSSSSEERR